MRCASVVIALGACSGDGDAEPVRLPGSPDATRALAFTGSGTPVAIGGSSTFGLAFLQHPVGAMWVRAANVPGFGSRAQLIGGGPGVPLLATSETTLYRLVDDVAMAWDGFSIPIGASPGTIFGTDATGRVYALAQDGSDGSGAAVTWLPGELRWAELAGTRPLGAAAGLFVVEPSGRVTWFVPGQGIVRADAGAQTTIVPCRDVDDCAAPITSLAYDGAGALTALVCPREAPPRFAIRLADGDTVAQALPLPGDVALCLGLDSAPDGTTLLAGVDELGEGPLVLLGDRATSWNRVAAASQALTYVIRDRRTVFGFADAQVERGIYQIEVE